jgi:hypothetical protein
MNGCEGTVMPWRKTVFGVLFTALLLLPRSAYACPS